MELLDDAIEPNCSVRTQGDLVRCLTAYKASLYEINGRMPILRDYRANQLKLAQEPQK